MAFAIFQVLDNSTTRLYSIEESRKSSEKVIDSHELDEKDFSIHEVTYMPELEKLVKELR